MERDHLPCVGVARQKYPEITLGDRSRNESGVDGVAEYLRHYPEFAVEAFRHHAVGDGRECQRDSLSTGRGFTGRDVQSADEVGDSLAVDEQCLVSGFEQVEDADRVDGLGDGRVGVLQVGNPAGVLEGDEAVPARSIAVVQPVFGRDGVERAVSHDGEGWSPVPG